MQMQQGTKDELDPILFDRLRNSEFIAHHLIYQEKWHNGDKVKDKNGNEYTLSIQAMGPGLMFYVFRPVKPSAMGMDIKVAFRGTNNMASTIRDLEAGGAGEQSFNVQKEPIMAGINDAIRQASEQSLNTPINISIYGHSLGGADAQRCYVAVMEKILDKIDPSLVRISTIDDREKPQNYFDKVKSLSLNVFNSAGVAMKTVKDAESYATRIQEIQKNMKPEDKIKFDLFWLHAAGDPVQQTGDGSILHNVDSSIASVTLCKANGYEKIWQYYTSISQLYAAIIRGISAHTEKCFDTASNGSMTENTYNIYQNITSENIDIISKKLMNKHWLLQTLAIKKAQTALHWLLSWSTSTIDVSQSQLRSIDNDDLFWRVPEPELNAETFRLFSQNLTKSLQQPQPSPMMALLGTPVIDNYSDVPYKQLVISNFLNKMSQLTSKDSDQQQFQQLNELIIGIYSTSTQDEKNTILQSLLALQKTDKIDKHQIRQFLEMVRELIADDELDQSSADLAEPAGSPATAEPSSTSSSSSASSTKPPLPLQDTMLYQPTPNSPNVVQTILSAEDEKARGKERKSPDVPETRSPRSTNEIESTDLPKSISADEAKALVDGSLPKPGDDISRSSNSSSLIVTALVPNDNDIANKEIEPPQSPDHSSDTSSSTSSSSSNIPLYTSKSPSLSDSESEPIVESEHNSLPTVLFLLSVMIATIGIGLLILSLAAIISPIIAISVVAFIAPKIGFILGAGLTAAGFAGTYTACNRFGATEDIKPEHNSISSEEYKNILEMIGSRGAATTMYKTEQKETVAAQNPTVANQV